jgi:hypothetical protein
MPPPLLQKGLRKRVMNKAERRDQKRFRSRYGHTGVGATHIREASELEVRRHVEKAKNKRKGGK